MKVDTLQMIDKLKKWDEEVKKQNFLQILAEMRKIETYIKELELRFMNHKFELSYSAEQLRNIYSEMEYLISMLTDVKKLLNEISLKVDRSKAEYEEAYVERKKIDTLLERFLENLRLSKEKLEERMTSEIFIGSIRKRE